jgi:hypothetical protein
MLPTHPVDSGADRGCRTGKREIVCVCSLLDDD